MNPIEYLVDKTPQIDWEDPHYADVKKVAIGMIKAQIKKAYNEGYISGENCLATNGDDYIKKITDEKANKPW